MDLSLSAAVAAMRYDERTQETWLAGLECVGASSFEWKHQQRGSSRAWSVEVHSIAVLSEEEPSVELETFLCAHFALLRIKGRW